MEKLNNRANYEFDEKPTSREVEASYKANSPAIAPREVQCQVKGIGTKNNSALHQRGGLTRVENKFTAIDLFCGAGGLTQGFKSATYEGHSFKVLAALDNSLRATETYKANHPEVRVIRGDIRDRDIVQRLCEPLGGHVDVIIGGPPCEAFSLAGQRNPFDPRAMLFYEYVRVVDKLKPHMFVMENVKGILTMITLRQDISQEEKKGVASVLNEVLDLKNVGRTRKAAPQYLLNNHRSDDPKLQGKLEYVKKFLTTVPEAIKQAFDKIGCDVRLGRLNAADYGVPQRRIRVVFMGAKQGSNIEIKFPDPTHSKKPEADDKGKPLQKWKTLEDALKYLPPLDKRTDDEVFEGSFSSIYMSRNRRMSWDEPSYTILASARHVLLHPDSPNMKKVERDKRVFEGEGKPRRLSVKECALIQGFPPNYRFVGNVEEKYGLIGDAVPPLLAQRVGEAVLGSLVKANISPEKSQ